MRVTKLLIFFVFAMAFFTPRAHVGAQVCVGCPVEKLKTTRIRDAKWHRDMALGKGITIRDAELIVRSARRNAISDRADAKAKGWPAIDAWKITQINASEWVVVLASEPWVYVPQVDARYFDVIDRAGRINIIGLIEGRLERVASIVIEP